MWIFHFRSDNDIFLCTVTLYVAAAREWFEIGTWGCFLGQRVFHYRDCTYNVTFSVLYVYVPKSWLGLTGASA